jgi:DNA-directed RNA polymerase subunit RPC12/RpoP
MSTIPPGHGENEGPGPMPRCPECYTVIDIYFAAGTRRSDGSLRDEKGRCPNHGLVTPAYGEREALRLRKMMQRRDVAETARIARAEADSPTCYGCGRRIRQHGTGDQGDHSRYCPRCGGRAVLAGRPRPDYDPRIDHPERYTDGPI